MNQIRGILMLAVAAIAFFQAYKLHLQGNGLLFAGLGVVALAMAAWRFTRKQR